MHAWKVRVHILALWQKITYTTPNRKLPLVVRLPEQDEAIRAAFTRYIATQPPERAILLSRYTLQDVIFKVVGVGSVGTFCAIGLFSTPDNEVLLLQIKEAQVSVLAPYLPPRHSTIRVNALW